jgi:hypothetical protein
MFTAFASVPRLRCRYWWGEICKSVFGRCCGCGSALNITRYGQRVCPFCRRRF